MKDDAIQNPDNIQPGDIVIIKTGMGQRYVVTQISTLMYDKRPHAWLTCHDEEKERVVPLIALKKFNPDN